MAQQITIDIVAETKKLTQGVNDATSQLNNLNGGISKTQQAAVGLASAFVLKEGVSFLKKANDEALDAEKTARLAAIAFGEGSTALQKIKDDADKFSKSLAVDNDDLIKLATTLSVNLPTAAKGSSTELVNLGYDVAALKGIDIETWVTKFSKAMIDGNLSLKEMQTLVPELTDSVYKQAESLFKAGKAQDAMNLLITEGQKKYGNAAESQVTGSQRIDKAMKDLYETIGTKVAPIVEKLSKFLADMLDWITRNQAVIIPLITVLGGFAAIILTLNAGLTAYNAIMSAWKVATTLATTAQTLFNAVMAANPIGLVVIAIAALIAIIVLLVKNWDTVTEVVGKVWESIKNFVSDAKNAIEDFVNKIIEKFTGFKNTFTNIWNNVKDNVGDFVNNVVNKIGEIPGKMFDIGKNIVTGLWNGINNMVDWLKNKIVGFFKNLLPDWAEKALGIASPSKVFSSIGSNIIQGLSSGLSTVKNIVTGSTTVVPKITSSNTVPATSMPFGGKPISITINAGLGTDPYKLGQTVSSAISKYGQVSSKATSRRAVL